MEIRGKYATAVCFASVFEDEAIQQIQRMCDTVISQGSRIRVMPDVHAGKGCTIGTTMTIVDRVVPNIVGVDIGCGMYTVRLNEADVDFERLDAAAHYIPSAMEVWDERREAFDLTGLRCFRHLRDPQRLERSLGTLGGGNHFIEVDRSADGTCYLIVHSGSRGLGLQVANHYQQLAIQLDDGLDEIQRRREEIIATYKAQGRAGEIQAALAELRSQQHERTLPDDLCCLYGSYMEDYLADVVVCQRFARRSRELMAQILMERAALTPAEAFHTIHNYIDTEEMILRKGAIAAHAGEKVLIPINMRDGSVLAVGRGNEEWNFSAPHGAGRVYSRTAARSNLSMEDYQAAMQGIYTTSVCPETLDESPMAYKSLADILEHIRDTVDIIDIMKPIYNFKASG